MNTFFIAGAQRSGTTLLSVMLSKHPSISLDSHSIAFRLVSCFGYYNKILPYNLNYTKEELLAWLIKIDYKGRLHDLLGTKNLSEFPDARTFIQEGINQKLKAKEKTVFGDKSPNIENFVPELLLLIPDAKFIHVVRDGRAAALSKATRAHKNIYLAAQEWVDSNIAGLSNQALIGSDRYKMIKYEDLLLEPEKALRSICQFLNLDYDPVTIISDTEQNDDDYVKSNLDTSKVDEFKLQLTKNQLKKLENIQGPLLNKFEYELMCPLVKGKHKQLSITKRIWYNQLDNIKQLFISKRKGMVNRKNVDVSIPIKTRVKTFVFEMGIDFLPDKVFKRIFRRRWIRDVYFNQLD